MIPAANAACFLLVPPHLRVHFAYAVNFVFSAVFCAITHKREETAGATEKPESTGEDSVTTVLRLGQ